ncbi:AAA family ATPase [Bacillus fonticola]|uniref:AAA family ATPase n=1 Tax=Bacillus fonticola TaxID=2728853 RepID=UPI0014742E12|nr:AAA family ATPase [Bacillus fonticola]
MKWLEARVYGFGTLTPGIYSFHHEAQCIYGPNETGKTTFAHFLSSMLWGMPKRKDGEQPYAPRDGRRFGGQLTVDSDDTGMFTIERIKDDRETVTVTFVDGTIQDGSWLEEWLSLSFKEFESLFWLHPRNQADLEGLTEKEFGRLLLSTGLSGSAQWLHLQKELQTKKEELFLPRGRKPVVNQYLKRRTEAKRQWQQKRKEGDLYLEVEKREQQLFEELQEKRAALERTHNRLNREIEWASYWPTIKEERALRPHLPKTPVNFPSEGDRRYKEKQDLLRSNESELETLREQQKSLESHIESLQLPSREWYEETKALLQKKERTDMLIDQIDELGNKESRWRSEWQPVEEALFTHSPNSSPPSLEPLWHGIEAWQKFVYTLEEKREKRQSIEQDIVSFQRQQQNLREEQPSSEDIEVAEKIVTEYEQQLENEKRSQDERSTFERLQAQQRYMHKIWSGLQIGFAVLLCFSVALYVWFEETAPVAGILAIVSIVLFGLVTFFRKKTAHLWQNPSFKEVPQSNHTKDEFIKACLLLDRHSESEQRQDAIHDRLTERKLEQERLVQEVEKQTEEQENLTNLSLQLGRELGLPFREELLRAHPKSYMERVREWHVAKKDSLNDIRRKEALQQQYDGVLERLTAWEAEHATAIALNSIESRWRNIEHTYQQWNEWSQQRKEQERDLIQIKQRIHLLQTEKSRLHEEIYELFKEAGVEDEANFYRRFQEWKAQEAYARIVPTLAASSFSQEERLEKEPPTEHKQQTLRGALQRLQQEVDGLTEAYTAQRHVREEVERSGIERDALQNFIDVDEKTRTAAKEWAAYELATHWMQQVTNHFQQHTLPVLLKTTSEWFSIVTDGAYTSIQYRPETGLLGATHRSGITYPVEQLSQGTKELLHVLMRMAFAVHQPMKRTVPFLLDELFAHIDEERARRLLPFLKNIAKDRQVFVFTCHSWVTELWAEVEVPVVSLLPQVEKKKFMQTP